MLDELLVALYGPPKNPVPGGVLAEEVTEAVDPPDSDDVG